MRHFPQGVAGVAGVSGSPREYVDTRGCEDAPRPHNTKETQKKKFANLRDANFLDPVLPSIVGIAKIFRELLQSLRF